MITKHDSSLDYWRSWVRLHVPSNPGARLNLFVAGTNLIAGWGNNRRLVRHPDMENFYRSVITQVCDGAQYCGVIYLMYWVDDAGQEIPLYVGKAERYGRNNEISKNLTNKVFFGRWGYPKFYHLGDLSGSLELLIQTGQSGGKHADWVLKLFDNPAARHLRREVYFWAEPWTHHNKCPCGLEVNVAALESCLIRHARCFFPRDNLNKDAGRDYCRCP